MISFYTTVINNGTRYSLGRWFSVHLRNNYKSRSPNISRSSAVEPNNFLICAKKKLFVIVALHVTRFNNANATRFFSFIALEVSSLAARRYITYKNERFCMPKR